VQIAHRREADPRSAGSLAGAHRDPFTFYRGTNQRAPPLLRAPSMLVCGDLHLEKFGAFKGDNRLCNFDINDFDDARRAAIGLAVPTSLDISNRCRESVGVEMEGGARGVSKRGPGK
jgi:uncharacterized protein (DUF2252 family)